MLTHPLEVGGVLVVVSWYQRTSPPLAAKVRVYSWVVLFFNSGVFLVPFTSAMAAVRFSTAATGLTVTFSSEVHRTVVDCGSPPAAPSFSKVRLTAVSIVTVPALAAV